MTELELQRIVDGELTSAERAHCLNQLQEQSPQWRTLALALLADQDLRRCFLQFKEDPHPAIDRRKVARPTALRNVGATRGALLLAASLVAVMASFAWWWQTHVNQTITSSSEQLASNEPAPSQINTEPAGVPADDGAPSTLVSWQPSGTMRLSAADDSQAAIELPVYEIDQLTPQAIVNQQLAELETLTEHYYQQGWRAGLDTHVYEGTLEDGRKLFIPVNVMHLEPISY